MANIGEIMVKIAADMTDFNKDMNQMGQTLSNVGNQVSQSTNQMSSSIQNMQTNMGNATNQMGTKWDWLRDKMIASNTKMMTEATKSQKVMDNLARMNVRGLDQQFLKISHSLELMARQGNITNVALKELGPGASFLDLKNQIKLINSGLGRMQALQVGVGLAFVGMNIGLAKMSAIVDGRLSPAFEQFQSTWLSALTPFVKAWTTGVVAIIKFGTAIGKAFDALATFSPLLSQMVFGFLFLTTALTLLLAPLAIGISAAGSFAVAFNVLWSAISPFVIGLMTVIGTAMMWAAAITVVVAAIYLLWTQCEAFRSAVISIWNSIKTAITTAIQAVVAFLQPAIQAVVNFVLQQWARIQQWWSTNGATIISAVQVVWSFITAIITAALNILVGIFNFVFPFIQSIVMFAWEGIKNVISGAIGVILSIISIFANLLTGNWTGLWNAVKNLASSALQLIWGLVQLWAIGRIIKVIVTFGSTLVNLIRAAWSSVSSVFTTYLARVASIVSSRFAAIRAVITAIWNGIRSFFSGVWGAIAAVVVAKLSSIRSAISSAFNTAKSIVSNAASSIKTTLSGLASQAYSWGSNLISMFGDGIKSKIGAVVAAAKAAADKIKSYLGFSSPTEEGPASNSHKWAPNLMSMFSSGIQAGIPKLRTSVTQAATVLASMDSNKSGSTSNQTQNITFNNYGSDQPSEKVFMDQMRRWNFLHG